MQQQAHSRVRVVRSDGQGSWRPVPQMQPTTAGEGGVGAGERGKGREEVRVLGQLGEMGCIVPKSFTKRLSGV